MSRALFIDANVPIYAAGREHRYKDPCGRILMMVAEHPEAFVTDAEVLQELVHLAVMKRLGVSRIITADTDFDRLPEVERLDPADVDVADLLRETDVS